jgi:G protein beta subunit-like protein
MAPTQHAQQQGYHSDVAQQAAEMSVVLCTAGCELPPTVSCNATDIADDHTIRFWEAWSGICYRQIPLQPQWVSLRLT